jgi:HSP20 family protein
MDSLFDSFLGGLPVFPRMFGTSGDRGFEITPHMDVKETDKEIVVEAELPGIGSFQRSLRLPDTIDEDKVEASFNNGVLKVSLPKRPEAIGKQRTKPIKKG